MTQAMIDWDEDCVSGMVSDAYDAQYIYQPAYLQYEQIENWYWPDLNTLVSDAKDQYLQYLTTLDAQLNINPGYNWGDTVVNYDQNGNPIYLSFYRQKCTDSYVFYGSEMGNFNALTTDLIVARGGIGFATLADSFALAGAAGDYIIPGLLTKVARRNIVVSLGISLLATAASWYAYDVCRYNREISWGVLRGQLTNAFNDGSNLNGYIAMWMTSLISQQWNVFSNMNQDALYVMNGLWDTQYGCNDSLVHINANNQYWTNETWWTPDDN
jgi:hypothetical protein